MVMKNVSFPYLLPTTPDPEVGIGYRPLGSSSSVSGGHSL